MTSSPALSWRHVLAAAVWTLTAASVAAAQPTGAPPALKAAFLYNFAKFAEWPADAPRTGALTICVFGDADIADALDGTVKGQTINGRVVAVLRVKADGLRACHVLYLSGVDPKRSREMTDDLKSSPVLTVSDRDQFAQTGGIIGLFVEGGKMRFAINVDTAQRAHLHISSKLLSLAKVVKDDHPGP